MKHEARAMPMTRPSCPRCGYDQSGAIAAWERIDPTSCPLAGLCTECGLEFAWRDLLNPAYAREMRFFEHALSQLAQSFVLTLWRAQRGWSFWRWVRMEHAVVPRRIPWIVVLGFPVAYLTTAILLGALAAANLGLTRVYWLYTGMPSWRFSIWNDGYLLHAVWPVGEWDGYGGLRIAPLAAIAVLAFLFMPMTFVMLPDTLRAAKVRRVHVYRVWVYEFVAAPLALGAPWALLCIASLARFWESDILAQALYQLDKRRWWLVVVFSCGWLMAWWAWASGRYLRLPHPWLIGAVTTVMSVLAATLVVLATAGGLWFFDGV